jgi:DNA-binding NarL/FixJ family response regulator
VLHLLAEGWTDRRIAAELGISPRTVGLHVSHLLAKLGVERRGEAAALARHRRSAEGEAVLI